jgi:hypothetical protein
VEGARDSCGLEVVCSSTSAACLQWLWMDADWRKWEHEDPWHWREGERRQWAEELFVAQTKRAKQRSDFKHRLLLQQYVHRAVQYSHLA